jgi:hypothetical protein
MPDAFTCPAGYTFESATGSCYRASNAPLPWLVAEAACEAEGAHLVVISDVTEAAIADRYRSSPTDFAWIGVSDLVAEGAYRDVLNVPATYVLFPVGEPEGEPEDCLLLRDNLDLGDGTCATADDYICEYDGRRGVSPAWGVCPVNYTYSGAGCYRARMGIGGGYAWLAAEATCAADGVGTHLLVIDSSEELEKVSSVASAGSIVDFWIGISDLVTEGVFVGVTNTSPTFLPWEGGAPTGSTARNCVRASTGVLLYSDEACENADDIMCEYDAIAPVPAAWGQ